MYHIREIRSHRAFHENAPWSLARSILIVNFSPSMFPTHVKLLRNRQNQVLVVNRVDSVSYVLKIGKGESLC